MRCSAAKLASAADARLDVVAAVAPARPSSSVRLRRGSTLRSGRVDVFAERPHTISTTRSRSYLAPTVGPESGLRSYRLDVHQPVAVAYQSRRHVVDGRGRVERAPQRLRFLRSCYQHDRRARLA